MTSDMKYSLRESFRSQPNLDLRGDTRVSHVTPKMYLKPAFASRCRCFLGQAMHPGRPPNSNRDEASPKTPLVAYGVSGWYMVLWIWGKRVLYWLLQWRGQPAETEHFTNELSLLSIVTDGQFRYSQSLEYESSNTRKPDFDDLENTHWERP